MSAFILRGTLRVRLPPIVLFVVLLMFLTLVRPGETVAPPSVCGDVGGTDLVVTYVSATPGTLHVGDILIVDFHVVSDEGGPVGQCIAECAHKWKPCTQNEPACGECKEACKEAYQPSPGYGVSGIHLATFLLRSLTTGQTSEYPNTPVTSGSVEGEYRAEIQITPDSPTGRVSVYVKAESLQAQVGDVVVAGPSTDTSSQEAEDTSGSSAVQVESQSTPTTTVGQLTLIALGLLAILILSIYVVVRRRKTTA